MNSGDKAAIGTIETKMDKNSLTGSLLRLRFELVDEDPDGAGVVRRDEDLAGSTLLVVSVDVLELRFDNGERVRREDGGRDNSTVGWQVKTKRITIGKGYPHKFVKPNPNQCQVTTFKELQFTINMRSAGVNFLLYSLKLYSFLFSQVLESFI